MNIYEKLEENNNFAIWSFIPKNNLEKIQLLKSKALLLKPILKNLKFWFWSKIQIWSLKHCIFFTFLYFFFSQWDFSLMHFCEGIYLGDWIWLMHIIIFLAHKIQKSFVENSVFQFFNHQSIRIQQKIWKISVSVFSHTW